MCSIDKSIDKVSRYFWYRDISKYRQYRPSLQCVMEVVLKPLQVQRKRSPDSKSFHVRCVARQLSRISSADV